ncbi:MAG: hypothetical protein U0821_22620 [Chloroflexota bacterium]
MALIVSGAIGLLSVLAGAALSSLGMLASLGGDDPVGGLVGGAFSGVIYVLAFILSGLNLYAGVKMRQLQSYGLCMAGAIVGMLPCSGCCLVGLPVGIWALVVLMNDEVKRAFNGSAPPSY